MAEKMESQKVAPRTPSPKFKQWLAYKILREFYRFLIRTWMLMCITITKIRSFVRDDRLGIETSDSCHFKDCTLNKDAYDYAPTRYDTLEKIIDRLNLRPDDVFVDIGCGKGRAVFVASFRKIKKAIGVDMDRDLIGSAQNNLRNIKAQHAPVEFICADAAGFDVREGTVFYLYNPFGDKTTKAVMENIRTSLVARPRRIRIALNGHVHRNVFDQQGWLEVETEIYKGNIVILHNPGQAETNII